MLSPQLSVLTSCLCRPSSSSEADRAGERRPRGRRKKTPTGSTTAQLGKAALALVLWMASSSALIFVNRQASQCCVCPSTRLSRAQALLLQVMVTEGFRYPLMLTGLNQVASTAAGWLVSLTGVMPIGKRPDATFLVTKLLPVVLCTAGALFFGNFAYLSLSVAFIQLLKVGCRELHTLL